MGPRHTASKAKRSPVCSGRRKAATTEGKSPARRTGPLNLISPVEVASAIDLPETGILDLACGRVLRGLFTGPGKRRDRFGRMRDEVRLDAVHRFLEASLLLGLEQRVVLERVVGLVT